MYFDMYNSLFYAYFYPIFLDFQKTKTPKTPLLSAFSGFLMARPEGFEPPAFRIGICCDIQLRYGRKYFGALRVV